jgi:cytochrome c oxidase cbb3-type subunit 3
MEEIKMIKDTKNSDTKIEGHSYDGIEELDNNLPTWWINLFYICIVFAALYWGYYELGGGPTLTTEYQIAKEELASKQKKVEAMVASEAQLHEISEDPQRKIIGARIFSERCIACHGDKGQGGIGPNLTDNYWIHGDKLENQLNVIMNGVADKGMPAWKTFYKNEDLYSIIAFIRSLKGTNPAGAKAPQGELSK